MLAIDLGGTRIKAAFVPGGDVEVVTHNARTLSSALSCLSTKGCTAIGVMLV